jgi:antitoxin (DNA-binding transcriptional repressor) of toxin-antitoxin stability system
VTEIISQRELRNESGRIMRELDAGRSFIVTRNAAPVGELRPLRRHRLVDRAVVAEIFRSAPTIDRQRLVEDLDAVTDQGIDPRA